MDSKGENEILMDYVTRHYPKLKLSFLGRYIEVKTATDEFTSPTIVGYVDMDIETMTLFIEEFAHLIRERLSDQSNQKSQDD